MAPFPPLATPMATMAPKLYPPFPVTSQGDVNTQSIVFGRERFLEIFAPKLTFPDPRKHFTPVYHSSEVLDSFTSFVSCVDSTI